VAKRKHIAVVGLGQFGGELARVLARDCEVLAVDIEQSRVDEVVDAVQRAVCLDAADLNSLRSVVSGEFDEAVVSTGGTMETSILATLHLQVIGVPVIRAKALSDPHGTILSLVGATEVIFPERETARRMARTIVNPNLLDFVPLEGDYLVRDMVLPKACHGHSLTELDLRRCLDLLILAVRRETEPNFLFLPGPDYVVQAGDVMVTIGREMDMVVAERADSLPVCSVRER
jgi:trk system potassium uptake protein